MKGMNTMKPARRPFARMMNACPISWISVTSTNPTTSPSRNFVAYAAIVTIIDPPAIAYCAAPNPSNGFTKSVMRNAFSFRTATPIATRAAERTRGKSRRRGVSSDILVGVIPSERSESIDPHRPLPHRLRYARVRRRASRAASRARLSHPWNRAMVCPRSVDLARVLGRTDRRRVQSGGGDRAFRRATTRGNHARAQSSAHGVGDAGVDRALFRERLRHRVRLHHRDRAGVETASGNRRRHAANIAGDLDCSSDRADVADHNLVV